MAAAVVMILVIVVKVHAVLCVEGLISRTIALVRMQEQNVVGIVGTLLIVLMTVLYWPQTVNQTISSSMVEWFEFEINLDLPNTFRRNVRGTSYCVMR